MSLPPFVLGCGRPSRPMHSNSDWPTRLIDQELGLNLLSDNLLAAVTPPMMSENCFKTWQRNMAIMNREMESTISTDKDKFQVNLDVQHFAPKDISVKTADGYIVVEGKHEEKKDEHGYISRQFVRRYALPDGVAPETVESCLSSDGVLTVTAPKKLPEVIHGERKVPITKTGPVRKDIKIPSNSTADE